MARWVGLVKGGVWGGLEGVVDADVEMDKSAEGKNMAAITAGLVSICEDGLNAMLLLCYGSLSSTSVVFFFAPLPYLIRLP